MLADYICGRIEEKSVATKILDTQRKSRVSTYKCRRRAFAAEPISYNAGGVEIDGANLDAAIENAAIAIADTIDFSLLVVLKDKAEVKKECAWSTFKFSKKVVSSLDKSCLKTNRSLSTVLIGLSRFRESKDCQTTKDFGFRFLNIKQANIAIGLSSSNSSPWRYGELFLGELFFSIIPQAQDECCGELCVSLYFEIILDNNFSVVTLEANERTKNGRTR